MLSTFGRSGKVKVGESDMMSSSSLARSRSAAGAMPVPLSSLMMDSDANFWRSLLPLPLDCHPPRPPPLLSLDMTHQTADGSGEEEDRGNLAEFVSSSLEHHHIMYSAKGIGKIRRLWGNVIDCLPFYIRPNDRPPLRYLCKGSTPIDPFRCPLSIIKT